MLAAGFALFDTALGGCGVAWRDAGLVAVQLPDESSASTEARLLRRLPGAQSGVPPVEVRRAIDGVIALLDGEWVDLSEVRLDMRGIPEFHRLAYQLARGIAPGQTSTYGRIAAELGGPHLARAVGRALGRNPFAPVVPCHRVLGAGGRPGGFSAFGGLSTKLKLLLIERADPADGPDLFSLR
jgi:methylated-DNA-[protein]-cysteine S-methyltransferase